MQMLNLHTPRGIAHWYDRTGHDIMARPQQSRPLEADPVETARSASPTSQQQPAAAPPCSAPAPAAAVGAAVSEPPSEARPGRGGSCGETAAASAAAAGTGSRAPHRGSASSAESPVGSGERPQALAHPSDKAECSARGKSGAECAAAGDQQRSPGSHASAGTLGNSHVSEVCSQPAACRAHSVILAGLIKHCFQVVVEVDSEVESFNKRWSQTFGLQITKPLRCDIREGPAGAVANM